jgi:hypothetical protein
VRKYLTGFSILREKKARTPTGENSMKKTRRPTGEKSQEKVRTTMTFFAKDGGRPDFSAPGR